MAASLSVFLGGPYNKEKAKAMVLARKDPKVFMTAMGSPPTA